MRLAQRHDAECHAIYGTNMTGNIDLLILIVGL